MVKNKNVEGVRGLKERLSILDSLFNIVELSNNKINNKKQKKSKNGKDYRY